MTAPRVEVRTITKRDGTKFDRAYLFCPDGHEVVSAPVTMRSAQRFMGGDYSQEFCGHGRCDWNRHVWDTAWPEVTPEQDEAWQRGYSLHGTRVRDIP